MAISRPVLSDPGAPLRPGLRERKKQATRRHIAAVAKELFTARGFDQVTVAEVAEAADVSRMTVFNYFARKEDLFLDQHAYQVRDVERALAERPRGESISAAMRRYALRLLDSGHELSGTAPSIATCWDVISASPALRQRLHEQSLELRDAIAGVLVRETREETTARLAASHVAATLAVIFETALRRMVDGDDVERVRRDQATLIATAFDLLDNGLGTLGS